MDFGKKTILIFLLLLLISCDKYSTSSIINNSKNEIIVKVKRDQKSIEKLRKEYIEKGFMVSEEVPTDYEIKVDSSNAYILDSKMGTRPDFYDIKEIEIFSGDTLILKCRRDQMQKLFTGEQNTGGYDLVIN